MDTQKPIDRLLHIMAQLRAPKTGCPWDREQDFQTLTRYVLEEAYEVVDAAKRGTPADLCEELGDLLLQVVFYAQIAAERGDFTFDTIATRIADKLVSRHPHVFGDATAASAQEVETMWEARKQAEKTAKNTAASASVLDDIPLALPALDRAEKIMKRVEKRGFRFASPQDARAKFLEELAESEEGPNEDEYGDVLFAFIAYARMRVADTTAAQALEHANQKFESRFRALEGLAAERTPNTPEDWGALWKEMRGK